MLKREALFLQYMSDVSILSCMKKKENTSSKSHEGMWQMTESFL